MVVGHEGGVGVEEAPIVEQGVVVAGVEMVGDDGSSAVGGAKGGRQERGGQLLLRNSA